MCSSDLVDGVLTPGEDELKYPGDTLIGDVMNPQSLINQAQNLEEVRFKLLPEAAVFFQ